MKQQISLGNSSALQLHKEIVAKADTNAVSNVSANKTSSDKGRTATSPTGTGVTWTNTIRPII